ncbi:hypothetical protein EYF80_022785 [Liparis tanakae]|uniref:Uncharacterized protein n=1 Tax=Liparis tanakae TaxID=230148 RepID=A0A4Z2HQF4_9TELE|nr:hypothetical protein EYF80_022785 [Liparis tanakae]
MVFASSPVTSTLRADMCDVCDEGNRNHEVEGHGVVVDDGQGPSGRGHVARHEAPAEGDRGRVHCLREQGNLLWVQVNQHVVGIQRSAHDHLHKQRQGIKKLN